MYNLQFLIEQGVLLSILLGVLLISILKQTPNATLSTMCNISFVFQTIPTKLGIYVYNYICNKMASANKVYT